jgi:serine protease Do
MKRMIRRLLLGFLGSAAIGLGAAGGIAGASAQSVGPSFGPQSLAPLVRMVAPQVVGIAVTEGDAAAGAARRDAQPGNDRVANNRLAPDVAPRKSIAAGSGFIVTPDGMIVTNNHVIDGAASIVVTLNDDERFPAKLIGSDPLTDVAVIKITSPHRLPVIHWGNSNLVQVGDWVMAAGNPFALGNSFTLGIVSAEGRDIGDGPFDHFLQLDAPINPGNSGGPAFNMSGAVVGINTAIVSPSGGSVGIGFAIPSNTARRIVAAIVAHGSVTRGWLGISVADLTDASGSPTQGAEITAVEPGGPAGLAGLMPADVVLRVNGSPVQNSSDLIRTIASITPGVKVTLQIERNGHIYRLPVSVARRPVQLGG